MLAPYIAQVGNPAQLTLKFRFQVNGTSDPDALLPGGCVTDVVRLDVGSFEIAFAQKYPVFVGGDAKVLPATATSNLRCTIDVADYSPTTGKLIVNVVGPTAAGDTTAVAAEPVDDDWVYCEVTFCTSSDLSNSVAI